jgi:hypothetical protein
MSSEFFAISWIGVKQLGCLEFRHPGFIATQATDAFSSKSVPLATTPDRNKNNKI